MNRKKYSMSALCVLVLRNFECPTTTCKIMEFSITFRSIIAFLSFIEFYLLTIVQYVFSDCNCLLSE